MLQLLFWMRKLSVISHVMLLVPQQLFQVPLHQTFTPYTHTRSIVSSGQERGDHRLEQEEGLQTF